MEGRSTFGDTISLFKQHLASQGKASATIVAYTKDIDQLAQFASTKSISTANAVTTMVIDEYKEYLSGQNYTTKSISRKINSIKAYFSFLETQKIISQNPALAVTHPKYDIKPPRILTKIEYRALRDACRHDSRIAAIVEVLLQTGMRISELANLSITDLDFDKNTIVIKAYESHPQRQIPLNQASKEAISRYLKDRPKNQTSQLFITKTGNQFLIRNIRSNLDRYFSLAGIKDTKVNDLRHTFIAHQLSAGTPLVYLSKLVGHKRLSTTEKYLDFVEEKPTKHKPSIVDL